MPNENKKLEDAFIVAHQIKSPVGTLQMLLRSVLSGFEGELNDRQKRLLESADRKATEAMETIMGLLALADAKRSRPGESATDVMDAVRRVHDRLRPRAVEQGVDVDLDLDADEAYVPAETASLTEALAALVDNAVKYTPADGRVLLRAEVVPETKTVRVLVSDSGIGIPEKEQARLFEPFFRASNAKKVVRSGTGLGLSYAKAVVETAGGTIAWRRSDTGGSEFAITLPLVPKPTELEGKGPSAPLEPAFRVVVVGGVAAGPKIAAKVMRLSPDASVTIVEKGRVLSYAGCGLPYYISGLVREQRDLVSTPEGIVRGPEYFERIKNVRVMDRTEAVRIDREARRVLVKNLLTGAQTWLPYDRVALTTGAVPIMPPIPGADLKNVFALHGLEHAEGIRSLLADSRAKDVTIVGGGLIGVEMTESLVAAGCRVTLVEMLPQILTILDSEMADLVSRHFESKGVRVLLETRVTGFEGDRRVERVLTERGSFPADMVIMGVGVRPNVSLAAEAGLALGETGAIRVDDRMRTSDPDIYAAGDCVECVHLITGKPCYAPFGSTANKQGRVAAINMCGGDDRFPGVLAATVCKAFDYTVGRSGLTEKRARELGYDVVTTLTPGYDRAHFMPHAAMIVLKLVGDEKTRKLLGIQAVGPGEAAKRIDVAAAAMTAGMTVDDVSNLDLCYAPSYADALDNLHTACNVMKNKLAGHMTGIPPGEVKRRLAEGEDLVLLDVRTHEELDVHRIEKSVHIPLAALRGRMEELPRDKPIVAFSAVSLAAYEAGIILKAHGFGDVSVMDGGILMWPGYVHSL